MLKNPWLSLWMSGANAVMGAARGRTTGIARRQTAAIMNTSAKQVASYWAQALTGQPAPKRRRTR